MITLHIYKHCYLYVNIGQHCSDVYQVLNRATMITNYHTLLSLASLPDVHKEFSQHAMREIVC